jgi:hypothetical protein
VMEPGRPMTNERWRSSERSRGLSGSVKDGMGTNPTPHDVRLSFDDSVAVLERRTSVVGPRHLEDARRSLHPLSATDFLGDTTAIWRAFAPAIMRAS